MKKLMKHVCAALVSVFALALLAGTARGALVCFGGSNNGVGCATNTDCPGGACRQAFGVADWPLPVLLAGKRTLQLYLVPSVISGVGGLNTYFGCTSTDKATMQVGVELFAASGGAPVNDAVATSLIFAPGATLVFGTGAAAGILVDSGLGGGGFGNGSARILATSTKLTCTAFVADAFNAPPTTSWQLTIIKGTSQKGD